MSSWASSWGKAWADAWGAIARAAGGGRRKRYILPRPEQLRVMDVCVWAVGSGEIR